MSLYQLSFMVGVALGPAVGGVLLGTSPDTIWCGGALALTLTGAGFLRLGNRIPDPWGSETQSALCGWVGSQLAHSIPKRRTGPKRTGE